MVSMATISGLCFYFFAQAEELETVLWCAVRPRYYLKGNVTMIAGTVVVSWPTKYRGSSIAKLFSFFFIVVLFQRASM